MSSKRGRTSRLPLQTGSTSVAETLAAAFPVAVVGLVGSIGARGFTAKSPREQGVIIVFVFLLPWLGFGVLFLIRALAHRASDVRIDAHGFRIDGGRWHGRRFDWKRIDPDGFVVKQVLRSPRRRDREPLYEHRLVVHFDGGKHVALATSTEDDEAESMEDLAALLRAGVARHHGAAPPADVQAPVDELVVLCSGCAAPVTPDDAAEVTCRYCEATVPMRDDVRRRVRDERAIDDARTREVSLIERLLDMPAAHLTNRLVALAGVTLLVSASAAIARQGGVAIFCAGVCMVLVGLARLQTTDRHALRTLTVGFAARRSGDDARCRQCDGPLPASSRVLVRCAYCAAVNLVTLELGADLTRARTEVTDLATVWRHRLERRSGPRGLVALGFCLAVLGVAYQAAAGVAAENDRHWQKRSVPTGG